MSRAPPNAHTNTHSDAASSSQLRLAHRTTRLSSERSAISSSQPLADLAQGVGGGVAVEVQLAPEPAQELLGATLAVLQPDHERGDDEHDPEPGQRGRDVQRVDAAERDRHEQRGPEDQVEDDGRRQPGRGQREAGVGAA